MSLEKSKQCQCKILGTNKVYNEKVENKIKTPHLDNDNMESCKVDH